MLEKKYTSDHEWIELSPDGKTGTSPTSPPPHPSPPFPPFLSPPSSSPPSPLTPPPSLPGTIGISTYASAALGDVVYVELPALGLEISKGDSIGAVESVKSASDIMTPVSGKIIEANGVLEEKPGMINKGPEGEGWIARIEVGEGGRGEVEGLMGGEEYRKMVEE